MIRKRERRWRHAARERVAAELIEEAELLTATGALATPTELARTRLPPPVQLPVWPPPPVPDAVAAPSAAPPALPDRPSSEAPPAPAAEVPATADQRLEHARALAETGAFPAARAAFEEFLQGAPTHCEALTVFGTLLARKGLWTQAVTHLRRALEVNEGCAVTWYQLGEALNRLDRLADARGAYERAVALDPRHARAWYGLAIVLDRLRDPEAATRMYRRSREVAGP